MAYQPITDPLPVNDNDVTAAVSIAANATSSGACTSLGGAGTFVVQLTGTWVGTVQVQITRDGINWVNITGSTEVQNAATGAFQTSGNITANGIYLVNVAGVAGARVITTAYTSGTIAGASAITPTAGVVAVQGTVSTSGSSSTLVPNSAFVGCSIYTGSIGATATAVKTSFGKVLGWHIFNSNSSTAYVQFFATAAGSVTVGTTAPVMSMGIPAGASVSSEQLFGWGFLTAITIAATTTRTGGTAPSNTVDINIAYV